MNGIVTNAAIIGTGARIINMHINNHFIENHVALPQTSISYNIL